jgi:hypothetical protein
LLGNSFFIRDDRFTLDDFTLSVVLFKILEADFDVKFTASGNDVLSTIFNGADDQWVRFGKLLEPFDELREVSWVFGLDSDSDDWGHAVFHVSEAVGIGVIRNGAGFHQILINSDQTNCVSAGDISNVLNGSAHHEDSSLYGLLEKIFLLSRLVV